MAGQLRRLDETHRRRLKFHCDGQALDALEGDTLLTAILVHRRALRQSEFEGQPRAGFCLMGACSDCVVWTADGAKLRACSTPVAADMKVFTRLPESAWPPLLSSS